MIVVENQRPGDLWVINGNRYTVVKNPIKTIDGGYTIGVEDAFQNPCSIFIDVDDVDEV